MFPFPLQMHVKEPNDAEAVADAVKTALTSGVDTEAASKGKTYSQAVLARGQDLQKNILASALYF